VSACPTGSLASAVSVQCCQQRHVSKSPGIKRGDDDKGGPYIRQTSGQALGGGPLVPGGDGRPAGFFSAINQRFPKTGGLSEQEAHGAVLVCGGASWSRAGTRR